MIPEDLKSFPHWVCWRNEQRDGKWTKVPVNPLWGSNADTMNPATWGSFEQACAYGHANGLGAGFVFHGTNPYSGVDLDDPYKRSDGTYITAHDFEEMTAAESVVNSHRQIINDFASYTEWSPSGRGVHILVRGKLPPEARKRAGKVEVYSEGRFFTVTGNTQGFPELPIAERQAALEILSQKMGGAIGVVNYDSQPERVSDQELLNMAARAQNGELFLRLWAGDDSKYGSGSEADLALANIICFYTENVEQAKRVFKLSPHYQNRPKLHTSHGEYLIDRVINLGFDQKPPNIDFENLKVKAFELKERFEMVEEREPEQPDAWLMQTRPDGLLGDIADFIYASAPRPVKEIALVAAMGLMAGICGKAFNVSHSGLNHYVVLLADSGVGKEAISSGITKLFTALANRVPAMAQFRGPGYIASAAALYKALADEQPCMVSILSEVGVWLRTHTDERAHPNQVLLLRAFLDLWTKSGASESVAGMAYSNKENNVIPVKAPAFSFVGESVPGKFYEAVTVASISQGLVPRFLVVPYTGPRVPLNVHHATVEPSPDLLDKLAFLVEHCLRSMNTGEVTHVRLADDAQILMDELERFCTYQHNLPTAMEVHKAMWNRVHLKTLRLAALRAVGRNWIKPQIELADAQWAKAFALADVHNIIARFESGEIAGTSLENDRVSFMLSAIKRYFTDESVIRTYQLSQGLYDAKFVPYKYLQRYCINASAFKSKFEGGGTKAVVAAIDELIAAGVLVEATPASVQAITHGQAQRAFIVTDWDAINSAKDLAGHRRGKRAVMKEAAE